MPRPPAPRERGLRDALLFCLAITLAYVLVLYAASGTASRHAPEAVRRRAVAVLAVCSVAWAPAYALAAGENDGIFASVHLEPARALPAAAAGLACTAVLFAGPLLHAAFFGGGPSAVLRADSPLFWRNYVIAPACEEFTFRGCMVPLLRTVGGLSPLATTLLCPAFFGAAHLHIAFDLVRHQGYPPARAAAAAAFTAAFTYVFGVLATALLLRTGSLGAPVAAHVFCNVFGLPDFGGMAAHARAPLLLGATAAGVVGFFAALGRLGPLFGGDGAPLPAAGAA